MNLTLEIYRDKLTEMLRAHVDVCRAGDCRLTGEMVDSMETWTPEQLGHLCHDPEIIRPTLSATSRRRWLRWVTARTLTSP
jgi:hypothetical protein